MKTIQLELSENIYDRVISFLELLPKNECHILEPPTTKNKSLREAFDAALLTNAFTDIGDPSAWEREIRMDRSLPSREQ